MGPLEPDPKSSSVSAGAPHLSFDDAPHAEKGLRESSCRFLREVGWEKLPAVSRN
jgi:hypothetical protein